MSRARQVANFDPALLAADEVSGDKVHGGTISGSPVLVTPNIGTPNAGVATNLTGIPAANLSGTITSGTQDAITRLGTVTVGNLSNTAIAYPTGHLLKVQTFNLASDVTSTNSSAFIDVFDIDYTPHGGSANNSTIYATLFYYGVAYQSSGSDGRKLWSATISGDDITNLAYAPTEEFFGCYDYGGSGINLRMAFSMELAARTLDGTGNAAITYLVQVKNNGVAATVGIGAQGNNTDQESHLLIREVQ